MATVSIIVPIYNAENTIGRCIESILGQTYQDFELFLVDDGSSDATPGILDSFAARDSRIRVVHKENSGVSDTRNRGLSMAQGEYIQFLDADDWIMPDATRLFVRAMEDNPGCDMVIADFYRVIGRNFSPKGDIEEEGLLTREEYADEMVKCPADFYYGVLWNKFYRRRIIEENRMRMDTQLNWAEDFIFNMEYVLHTNQIYVLKVPVYYYVKTEGSLVSQGGASISRVVRMKMDVIEYYSRFYKDIYTEGGYLRRSPAIYSFLLNFARDGSVTPVEPRRQLGQERVDVRMDASMEDNPFALNFYEDRMLENALERIRKGYDLEEKEVQILLYLKLAGGTADVREISSYTGWSARSLAGSLQRLTRRRLIQREKVRLPEEDRQKEAPGKAAKVQEPYGTRTVQRQPADGNGTADAAGDAAGKDRAKAAGKTVTMVSYGREAAPITEALERAFRDIEELRFQGFSKEEIRQYKELSRRAARNVRNVIGENVSVP